MKTRIFGLFLGLLLVGCGAVQSTYTVGMTPRTRAMILRQPEFARVDCGAARTTLVGADVSKQQLLLHIRCVAF